MSHKLREKKPWRAFPADVVFPGVPRPWLSCCPISSAQHLLHILGCWKWWIHGTAEQLDVGSACSHAGERFLPRGRGCDGKHAPWSQCAAPPQPWLSCPTACPGAHIHANTHGLQPGRSNTKFGFKEIPLLAWIELVPAVAQMRGGL